MKRIPVVCLLLSLAGPLLGQTAVSFEPNESSLRVQIGGKPFATYFWKHPDVKRPFFAHVHAPDSQQRTRNFPPVEGKDATDHAAMHPGLWLAFGDLGGGDFWRNKGAVEHVEFVEKPTVTKDGLGFAVKNRYRSGDKVICEEVCRMRVTVRPEGNLLDWTSEFSGAEDFSFGDQEEMGLGIRVATPLAVKNGGRLANAEGLKNEKGVWGKQSDWCDYGGLAVLTHPSNFRRSWFHARDYGLLVANPFARNAFTKGEKSSVIVRKGETFRLRFGVLVHSGEADVGAIYREWVGELPWVEVSKDKHGFVRQPSGEPFAPWGFNYDHDEKGRLLEDYWEEEWPKVETDFARMKELGANVVRVHLQTGKFMDGPDRPNAKALDRLTKLVQLAERRQIYLNLTGLGCYHKKDVPAWYDKLGEKERWETQARFWEAVAGRCARSPAIFCYDLMNEPVVPGGARKVGDWLGGEFGGKHFVQFVTLDQSDRPRPEIARRWVDHLVAVVRKADQRHLITVGLVDWSLDRKGLTSGFVPEKVAEKLDFVSVHLYPETGKFDEATQTLKGFAVGKPVVVEETFPLKCSPKELNDFISKSEKEASGWISFYWGKPPEELRKSKALGDAILLDWLDRFEKRAKN